MENNNNVLEIRGLNSYFFTEKGVAPAVDGLDLDIPKGKIIGLVGESGCTPSPVWCPTCCTCRRAARSATAANMPPTNAARKKRSCIPLHRIIRCAASAVRRNINERGKTRSSFAGKRYL